MAAPRLRRVSTRRELETVRDDFITQGYQVLREGEETVLMRRGTWGSVGAHLLVALFTVWWTIGIGNLVYALVAHYSADQVLVKMEAPAETLPPA